MNRDLRTRFNLLRPDREKFVTNKQAVQKSSHDRRARTRVWLVGDRVMVRNVRPGPDWIVGTVLEVLGPVIETEDGSKWKRHADQLKDWLPSPMTEAIPESLDDEVDAPDPDPSDDSSAVNPELESPPEVRSDDAGTPSESPPASDSPLAAPIEPRYPRRNRQPPRYYSPGET